MLASTLASHAPVIPLQEIRTHCWEAHQFLAACAIKTITEVVQHRVRHVELAASVQVKPVRRLPLLILAIALPTHTGKMF